MSSTLDKQKGFRYIHVKIIVRIITELKTNSKTQSEPRAQNTACSHQEVPPSNWLERVS